MLICQKNINLKCTYYFIMKILNQQQLQQQIAFNHSSDIDFKNLWIFTKNIAKNNVLFQSLMLLLHHMFRKNLAERILKLIMTTDDKIRNKKRQYDINRKAAKISVLSSGKIDTCEYLTGE